MGLADQFVERAWSQEVGERCGLREALGNGVVKE